MDERSRRPARLARLHPLGGRGLAAAPAHRRDRRLPDARARRGDADRGHARRAARARRGGHGAPHRLVELLGGADRGSRPRRARARADALRRRRRTTTRSSSARSRTRSCPSCERLGIGMLPFFPLASGLLTGKYTRGEAGDRGPARRPRDPRRALGPARAAAAVRGRARRAAALGRDRRPARRCRRSRR